MIKKKEKYVIKDHFPPGINAKRWCIHWTHMDQVLLAQWEVNQHQLFIQPNDWNVRHKVQLLDSFEIIVTIIF